MATLGMGTFRSVYNPQPHGTTSPKPTRPPDPVPQRYYPPTIPSLSCFASLPPVERDLRVPRDPLEEAKKKLEALVEAGRGELSATLSPDGYEAVKTHLDSLTEAYGVDSAVYVL